MYPYSSTAYWKTRSMLYPNARNMNKSIITIFKINCEMHFKTIVTDCINFFVMYLQIFRHIKWVTWWQWVYLPTCYGCSIVNNWSCACESKIKRDEPWFIKLQSNLQNGIYNSFENSITISAKHVKPKTRILLYDIDISISLHYITWNKKTYLWC